MTEELPPGWLLLPLQAIVRTGSGDSKLIKGKLPSSPAPGLFPAFSASGQDVWVSEPAHQGRAIIVSAVGARCGKCFKADGRWSAIANTHVLWPNEDILDRDFLWWRVNDEGFWKKGGSAQPFVKVAETLKEPFPLPPLAEQRRIVARIEALFARIRQARADLLRIAPLADRYRQQSHRKLLDPGEHGWTTVTIDEIAHLLQYGSSAKTSDDASGVPVLRMGNIVDGALDLTSLKFLPRDHHEFPSLLLQPGDILFNRTNSAELVGKTAVYEGRPAPCSFASYLIRLRVRGIDPTIVAAYINSPAGRVWAAASISQQVGQANINGAKLRALRVPRVPDHEQQEVADALRAATRIRTRLTAEATRALALLDHLERSILTRAFRGELVPQDPADEPASVSLARSQEGAPAAPRRGRPRRAA